MLDNLKRLRRMAGSWGVERLDGLPSLVDYCGHGNVHNAFEALEALRRRHGTDPASDVGAYFYSAGWKVGRETLDQRLSVYSREFGVVERTALRRSDRGARQLASLIRPQSRYDRPIARLYCFQRGSVIKTRLALLVEEDASWRRPAVYLNGERQERRDWKFGDSSLARHFIEAREEYPDTPLDYSVDARDALASVRVLWVMPVWPSWDVTTHALDPRLFVHTELNTNGDIEVRFKWWSETARELGPDNRPVPDWVKTD